MLLSWTSTIVDRQPVQVTKKIERDSARVVQILDADTEHQMS